MSKLFRISCLVLFLGTLCSHTLDATHNRAGEITYEQLGPLTIRATITTYTKASSVAADRDSLRLFWGDGEFITIARANGTGEEIPGEDIKINYYIAEHTYPGKGSYVLSFTDPNRVNNIQNVNFPNSVDVPFYVETRITLIESQFQGPNNSVILLQPPVDFGCVGRQFKHNPNAYDPDGDSISYELIVPLQSEGIEVPNYKYPDEIIPGLNNIMTINPLTGDVVWESPQTTGEFNIAIRINEYRDGVLLNSVIRDMQILIEACMDTPPEIFAIDEICVTAGETINLPVQVTDVDTGQQVRVFGTGGPFIQEYSPAFLSQQNQYVNPPLTATFVWDTKCEHISDSKYKVVFRGQDNSIGGATGNSVLTSLEIKVLGPAPTGLDVRAISEALELTWDRPYDCEQTVNNYFYGFRVYRKEGSESISAHACARGLENSGYEIIAFRALDTLNSGRYIFIDENVDKESIYCYRIVGVFADRTSSGQPFNLVESKASEETCLQLERNTSLITKVSVNNTDPASGSIDIEWIKPNSGAIDTAANSGPYAYAIYRSNDGTSYEQIYEIQSPSFSAPIDLSYLDTGLNTRDDQYHYRVDFYANDVLISNSKSASSVYTSISSTDRKNQLSWDETVPWNNELYTIEELQENQSFEFLESTINQSYDHSNLINEREYCYRIKSSGSYGLLDTPAPLINYSQVICGTPIDTVGPCPPEVEVDNPCSDLILGSELGDLRNILTWSSSASMCDGSQDVASYIIYFAADSTALEYVELATINADDERFFEHTPESSISGCYAIQAIDELGNLGLLSDPVCVRNCPIYRLPNTFTPNQDGANELFVPLVNKFVPRVEFKVYNRWGNVIYESIDPALNWDGQDRKGRAVPEGTYYYACKVLEEPSENVFVEAEVLTGYIQIFR